MEMSKYIKEDKKCSSFFVCFLIWKYLPREILGILIIINYEKRYKFRKNRNNSSMGK